MTKNAGKACNNRLYRHIRTFEKIIKNYFVIYYKNIKSTDGSWSMMDAEILDMYQYDYESKEVKDLQKTSW